MAAAVIRPFSTSTVASMSPCREVPQPDHVPSRHPAGAAVAWAFAAAPAAAVSDGGSAVGGLASATGVVGGAADAAAAGAGVRTGALTVGGVVATGGEVASVAAGRSAARTDGRSVDTGVTPVAARGVGGVAVESTARGGGVVSLAAPSGSAPARRPRGTFRAAAASTTALVRTNPAVYAASTAAAPSVTRPGSRRAGTLGAGVGRSEASGGVGADGDTNREQ